MTVGRYRVLGEVGAGAFATVYRAYDVQHKRYVALKVLKEEHHEESEMAQRVRREVAAALRLAGHPNIVSVYALGHVERALYIAMEFIDGSSLTEAVEGPAEPELVVRVATAVASALDAAHSVGIIHRDVKPSNVMLARDGRIVLSDFGIAGLMAGAEHMTATGILLGTPEYMAPELTTGSPASPASDQYALGVMIYKLLVGQGPFAGATPLALLYAHVHEAPRPPSSLRPELPPAVDAVVLRALAKAPEQRFEHCLAFAASLSAALGITMPEHGPTRAGSTLDALIAKARELAASGDHDGAQRAVEVALKLMPGHPALTDLQQELETERRLAERYERGVRHLQAREWLAAREIFNALFAERPDYRDVAELRKQAFAGIMQAWAKEERRAGPRKPADDASRPARGSAIRPQRGRSDEARPASEGGAHNAPRSARQEHPEVASPPEPKKTPEQEELEDLAWRFEAAKSAVKAGDWRTAQPILEGLQARAPTLLDENRRLFLGAQRPRTELERRAPTAREVVRMLAEVRSALEEGARVAEQTGRPVLPSYRPARILRSAFAGLLSGLGKPKRSRKRQEAEEPLTAQAEPGTPALAGEASSMVSGSAPPQAEAAAVTGAPGHAAADAAATDDAGPVSQPVEPPSDVDVPTSPVPAASAPGSQPADAAPQVSADPAQRQDRPPAP